MAVPKKRKSSSKRDSRRAANSKIFVGSSATCSRCGQQKAPHVVCPHCGYYKNTQVLEIKDKSQAEA